jgi:hypothetical protein
MTISVLILRAIGLSVILCAGLFGTVPVTPAGATSNVLYRASWTHGVGRWTPAGGTWTVSGAALNYSGSAGAVIVAPYHAPAAAYAIEARIQMVAWKDSGVSENKGFGILVRAKKAVDPTGETAGLLAGVGRGFMGCDGVFSQAVFATADTDLTSLKTKNAAFRPGPGWHSYRVEARGRSLTLVIDGKVRNSLTTSKYADGNRFGLFSLSTQIRVESFQVLRLHP